MLRQYNNDLTKSIIVAIYRDSIQHSRQTLYKGANTFVVPHQKVSFVIKRSNAINIYIINYIFLERLHNKLLFCFIHLASRN